MILSLSHSKFSMTLLSLLSSIFLHTTFTFYVATSTIWLDLSNPPYHNVVSSSFSLIFNLFCFLLILYFLHTKESLNHHCRYPKTLNCNQCLYLWTIKLILAFETIIILCFQLFSAHVQTNSHADFLQPIF